MRLAVTRSGFYNADIYCVDSRSAKQKLKEEFISILAIDFYLKGRESGCDVIDWAYKQNLLPCHIVIIERDRIRRRILLQQLLSMGYRSKDETTFIKHRPCPRSATG